MAPKGRRPAGSPPRHSKRRRTTADPVAPKCKDVEKAIGQCDALSSSCKEMLMNMIGSSLTVYAADRHSYQTKAVQMLGETVAGVQTQLQNAVQQTQALVDNSDREKATRDEALQSATAGLEELEKKSAAAKAAVDEGKAALSSAKAALASAGEAIETNESEIAELTQLKTKLETTLKDIWEPLKNCKASGHDGRKNLNFLEKVFTEVGLEAGLVEHVPDTLRKDPEARRTFDLLVVKHVDEQASQCMVKTEGDLQKATEKTGTLADDKAKAEAAITEASEKVSANAAAKDAAQAALKEGQDAMKSAQTAVNSFEREMASAADNLESAKSALSAFTEGACESFAALRDLAERPPEVEKSPESEKPSEEAADAAAAA